MIEWKAAEYADIAALQKWLADTSLTRLPWRGDERVLDIGCGDGRVSADIAARVPRGRVTAIDVSHDMIAFAQRTHPIDNLDFAVCDVLALSSLGAPHHDLVTSFNALHWVQAQDRVLGDVFALLKPGGRAFLQMVGHGERKSLEHVIREICMQPAWKPWLVDYARPYDHVAPATYETIARAAGFQGTVSMEPCEWDFKTREGFLAWAEATFQYWTKHLPEDRHHPFIHEVLDAYRALADGSEHEANRFHFYQMKADLTRPA